MAVNYLWHWRALSPQGERQHGSLWATDRHDATSRLLYKDIYPLVLSRSVLAPHWKREHCHTLFAQLATLLQAGLTLSDSLTMLAEQHPSKQWQALLAHLSDTLSEGRSFAQALAQWPEVFTPLYISMVKTGEMTGKLEVCCRKLATQQKTQQQLSQKVKKALRYPAIILTLAAGVVLAMVTLVLPEFTAIYKTFNTPLPWLTQTVMAMADVVRQQAVVLLILTSLPLIVARCLRHHQGWQRLRQRFLLRIPIMGVLLRGQKLGQIFTVLSLTQQAGIAFLQGLESAQDTMEDLFWQEQLLAINERIASGDSICSSFAKAGIFTPLCLQLVKTGEASGSLDTMLANLAHHHNEQTFQHADNLASLLEPLLLIVTGVIIGTLVVAMYLPIFHLGDALSAG